MRRGERGLIGVKGLRGLLAKPRVENLHMRGNREQPLVLMLPAEVDRPANAGRQLAHGTHTTVNLHAATTVGRDAPAHHAAVGVSPALEEAALDLEGVRSLAHRAGISALPHQELDCREKRRLAGTRLARKHREAARGLDGGIPNERDVTRVQLVEHQRPALP